MHFSRQGAGFVALSTVVAATLTLLPQTSGATTSASAPSAVSTTNYGFAGTAFGTRVRGGSIPANSGRTALAVLGCTRRTGVSDSNSLPSVNLGTGLGTVHGIHSVVRTYRKANGSVNVRSVNNIVQVGATNSLLRIDGIHTVARAWHDARGFHRSSRTTVGGVFSLGIRQNRVGNTINIPGVATLTLNSARGSKSPHGAFVSVNGVIVKVAATGTTAVLGHASARINDGLVTGVLGGVGIAAKGSVLNGFVRTGQVARQPLPCQGTNGVWRNNTTVGVNVPNVVHFGVATGSARGDQISRTSGYAQTRGKVARAAIGNSRNLVVRGVVGAANVRKSGGNLTKTARGTHILSITFNGRTVRIPTRGNPVHVGKLAVLSVPRVSRSRYGISVVALRVNLTNTLATLDLGVARASIRPF